MTQSDPLRAIEARIAELEKALSVTPEYRELIILRDTQKKLQALTSGTNAGVANGATPRIGQPKGSKTILEAARSAMDEVRHPLTTKELLLLIPKHGGTVGGKDPATNLTSMLSKSAKDVESIRWQGKRAWWFKGRSLPADTLFGGTNEPQKETAGTSAPGPAASRNLKTKGGPHGTALA